MSLALLARVTGGWLATCFFSFDYPRWKLGEIKTSLNVSSTASSVLWNKALIAEFSLSDQGRQHVNRNCCANLPCESPTDLQLHGWCTFNVSASCLIDLTQVFVRVCKVYSFLSSFAILFLHWSFVGNSAFSSFATLKPTDCTESEREIKMTSVSQGVYNYIISCQLEMSNWLMVQSKDVISLTIPLCRLAMCSVQSAIFAPSFHLCLVLASITGAWILIL